MSLKEDFYNLIKNHETLNWLHYFKEYTNEDLTMRENEIYDDYWYWQYDAYIKREDNIFKKFKEKYILEKKYPEKYTTDKRGKI